jgi:hypothetical protein
MPAYGVIVAYVILWLAWSSLVGLVLRSQRRAQEGARGPGPVLLILASALAPVFALAVTTYYTGWIASSVNEVLSLATPVLFVVFVVQSVGTSEAL